MPVARTLVGWRIWQHPKEQRIDSFSSITVKSSGISLGKSRGVNAESKRFPGSIKDGNLSCFWQKEWNRRSIIVLGTVKPVYKCVFLEEGMNSKRHRVQNG